MVTQTSGNKAHIVKPINLNRLLQNQLTNDLETWYVASGAELLPNYDLGLILTFIMKMSDLLSGAFMWEITRTFHFMKTIEDSCLK